MTTKINSYIERDIQYLKNLDSNKIEDILGILDTIGEGRIYIAGNGGSAITASHFAEDLNGTTNVKAISLCNDVSWLTAIANDFGYENVFEVQLKKYFEEGDILLVISASGNSQNLIGAVDFVNEKGGISVGFLGFDGGILKHKCSIPLVVETSLGEYGAVEDAHLVCVHAIINSLMNTNQ